MREYCLVNESGKVLNMCMSYKPTGPVESEYQKEFGYKWVPVSQVSQQRLREYKYWDKRP